MTEPHGRVATTGFDVASVSVSVSVYEPYDRPATTGRLVLRTLRDVYYELHHRNLGGRAQYTCTDHSLLRRLTIIKFFSSVDLALSLC